MMWGVDVRNVGMTSVPRDWVSSFSSILYFGALGLRDFYLGTEYFTVYN